MKFNSDFNALYYFQGFIQVILMSVIRYKKLNLSTEFWNSTLLYVFLFVCLFVCLFVSLLRYWSSFAVSFLAVKIKRYLHVSHMQSFDYLHKHNITNITYWNIWKMKIWNLNSSVSITSIQWITYFCNLEKGI